MQFTEHKSEHTCSWQLVTQRYNNMRLIAMMHLKRLC